MSDDDYVDVTTMDWYKKAKARMEKEKLVYFNKYDLDVIRRALKISLQDHKNVMEEDNPYIDTEEREEILEEIFDIESLLTKIGKD